MSDTETEFDPFEDEQPEGDEGEEQASTQEGDEGQSEGEPTGDPNEAAQNQEGEGEPAGDPNAEGDGKTEKMIPESRFKAALKDVTDERDRLAQENTSLKAKPAAMIPDQNADPEGWGRHVRLETSKQIMSETHKDYNDKIKHFQEMAAANPHLNEIVANHAMPAKFAYDLAARDMEIRELSGLKTSDEWKQFQTWKAAQAQQSQQQPQKSKVVADVTSKLPTNLNRATSASNLRTDASSNDDDELFKGAL